MRAKALASTVALLLVALAPPAPAAAADGAVHPVRPTSARQALVVSTSSWTASAATVTPYNWTGDGWRPAGASMSGYIGAKGFTAAPTEADGATPIGQYAFTVVFGHDPNPGARMPYRTAGDEDDWVDDPTSPLYNTWQSGPAQGRWSSAEALAGYSLAVAFDFNQNPVVAGGNSAIFLHEGSAPTPGCIVLSQADLLGVVRWLDPSQSPVIVLGVDASPPPHAAAAAAAAPTAVSDSTPSAPTPAQAAPQVGATAAAPAAKAARRIAASPERRVRSVEELAAATLALVLVSFLIAATARSRALRSTG